MRRKVVKNRSGEGGGRRALEPAPADAKRLGLPGSIFGNLSAHADGGTPEGLGRIGRAASEKRVSGEAASLGRVPIGDGSLGVRRRHAPRYREKKKTRRRRPKLGLPGRGTRETDQPPADVDSAAAFFFNISEPASGETPKDPFCRSDGGQRSVSPETCPTPPSDSIWLSGVRRRHAPNSGEK